MDRVDTKLGRKKTGKVEVNEQPNKQSVILEKGSAKRGRNWFFTLNNYTVEEIGTIEHKFDKYTFQEEIGENGTRHLQGVVIKNTRFSTLKKILPRAHWEVCKNIYAAREYCTKLATRNGRIYTKGMDFKRPLVIKDYFIKHKPKKWQSDILTLLMTEPNERKIYWFWEAKGGVGKSALTRHLIMNYDVIAVSGSARDIKCGFAKAIENKRDIKMVIVDVPRCSFSNLSYKAIEEIKNGFFYSTKYESDQYIFNIPHVVIFANSSPNLDMLSKDRWIVIEIE